MYRDNVGTVGGMRWALLNGGVSPDLDELALGECNMFAGVLILRQCSDY